MNHYNQIKKMMPLELGYVSEMDMEVEGALLDAASARILDVVAEMFPDTAQTTLPRWEAEYGIVSDEARSSAERRSALAGRVGHVGDLSPAGFKRLAAAMGYNDIDIHIDAAAWRWTVVFKDKPAGDDIKDEFNALNPPHMTLIFSVH